MAPLNTSIPADTQCDDLLTSAQSPIWRPFTQMQNAPAPYKVRSAKGAMLTLEDGREVVDCISSWWVNIHGHGHPEIAAAIHEQAMKLEHVLFAGFTHEPAEQLARVLVERLPDGLTKIFYSDNGSTAVEVALKMAFQYWRNQGEERNRFIGFEGGYHGDTIGAMSIGGSSHFWQNYRPIMSQFDSVPYPKLCAGAREAEPSEEEVLSRLDALLDRSPGEYAGIFIEPLVQGVAGMKMCSTKFLVALRKLCDQRDLLLIYDEVMTGFGRTGDWFAALKSKTVPDLICVSKGITGGFLPLAVTACVDKIYNSFLSDDAQKMFCHGHSYTANPIACAAALKSMELLEQKQEVFKGMEGVHRTLAERYLRDIPTVKNLRFCGTIAAFEVNSNEEDDYYNNIAPILKQKFMEKNLLIRPLGNTVYLLPPYCIDEPMFDQIYANIADVLKRL